MNPSFNANQVIAALKHLDATHLIISAEAHLPHRAPRNNEDLLRQLVTDLSSSRVESEVIPSLKHVVMVDNSAGRVDTIKYRAFTPYPSIASEMPADGAPLPPQDLSRHDIVNIQFTSGTTSLPKAACLTHRSILNNGAQIGDRLRLTERDIVCCPPPLFHCFGSILGYMATATHGAAIVFPAESFDGVASLRAVQEEKCTALYGVPTMFIEELRLLAKGEVEKTGFEQLRTGIAAGSSIPANLMRELHRTLNLTELTICYGMTETSPVSAMTTTDDPIDKRINTVGRLMPHVEAKIVDPADRSRILPVNTRGELAVSGYLLMKEYWGAPDRTAEVMVADHEGKVWMHVSLSLSLFKPSSLSDPVLMKPLDRRRSQHVPRRIHHHHRAHQRSDHPRRREHPPARDRELPAGAPGRARGVGRRGTRREIRRGGGCVCRAGESQDE